MWETIVFWCNWSIHVNKAKIIQDLFWLRCFIWGIWTSKMAANFISKIRLVVSNVILQNFNIWGIGMQSTPCICNSNSMEDNFQQISMRIFFQLNLLQLILCQTSIIGTVCINKVLTNRFRISIIKVIIN